MEDATPIHDAEQKKPPAYVALRLFFSDGSSQGGIWTGRVWWSEGRAVHPVRWQLLQPREMNPPAS